MEKFINGDCFTLKSEYCFVSVIYILVLVNIILLHLYYIQLFFLVFYTIMTVVKIYLMFFKDLIPSNVL